MTKWQRYTIIQEHEDWIAVNKPAGIASIPARDLSSPSLLDLLEIEKKRKFWVVHRIDKATRGVILFAKNQKAHQKISLLFQNQKIKKHYTAFVWGVPFQKTGTISSPLKHLEQQQKTVIHSKGKHAITHYEMIESFDTVAVINFHPTTGRTHQIRAHAKHIGHPIIADNLYSDGTLFYLSHFKKKYVAQKHTEEKPIISELALHCSSLRFDYQSTSYCVEAPLYKDMQAALRQLQKINKAHLS